MTRIVSFIAVSILALLGVFPTGTQACSCLASTFEKLFKGAQFVDSVYVLGQIKVKDGFFNGWAGNVTDYNADVYFLAYQQKSYKGCKGCRGDFLIYKTAGNSAACGVSFEPGWYVVGSGSDYSEPKFKSVNLCGLVTRRSKLTKKQKQFIAANTQTCKKC